MNHSGSVAATAAACTPTGDAVPKLSALASVVWNKAIILLKRYTFNTITQMVSVYFLFLVVFFGARGITSAVGGSPIALGDTLDSTIVGFFLVGFCRWPSTTQLAYSIMNEARLGTLEQLMMSPFGFRWVAVFEVAASTVTSLVMSGFVLAYARDDGATTADRFHHHRSAALISNGDGVWHGLHVGRFGAHL